LAISLLWLFTVNPIVCIAIGAVLGGLLMAVLTASGKQGPAALAALPTFILVSLWVAAPVGVLAGLLGTVAIWVWALGHRHTGRREWIRAGLVYGGLAGALAGAAVAAVLDRGNLQAAAFAIFGTIGVVAGAPSGAAMAWLGWRELAPP
jgi:hypothetical protein